MKSFRITQEDFTNAQLLHGGKRLFLSICLVFVLVGAVFIAGTAVAADQTLRAPHVVALACIAILIAVAFRIALKRKLRSVYQAQPALQDELSVAFNQNGIIWTTHTGSERSRFSEIIAYKRNRKVILLYNTKRQMRIIPMRAFESQSELNELIALLQSKMPAGGSRASQP